MAKAIWLGLIFAPILGVLFLAFPVTMAAVGLGLLGLIVIGLLGD